MNSICIEFKNGERTITSRYAIRNMKVKKVSIEKCECGRQIKIKGADMCEDCQIEYNAYAINRLLKKIDRLTNKLLT